MRPFTEVVDRLADEEPNRVWVKMPETRDGKVSWCDITFRQFSQAVNTMAHWMDQHFGQARDTDKDDPVAYIGINDIRYPIVILAALKTGHKALLTSPRNSIEGHSSLLDATGCTKILFSQEFHTQASELATKIHTVKTAQVPDLDEILRHGPYSHPYHSKAGRHMEDDETVMILHSSGTTGLPKPIPQKAGIWRVVEDIFSTPALTGRRFVHDELYGTRLIVLTVPFFHSYGINLLSRSIYHKGALVLLPSDRFPSAELVLQAMEGTNPSAIVCAPSILEDMVSISDGLAALSKLDFVFYGGAPLANACGDAIAKVTRLVNGIGSTEMYSGCNYLTVDPADWEYFEWDPMSGIEMETISDSSLAELVVRRHPNMHHQFVFYNYPHLNEWRTHDLFEQHTRNTNLWRYVGRMDDMIVLSNGEKINPVSFEKSLEGHPWIRSALIVGMGQFQAGLLIEPQDRVMSDALFIDGIWSAVEQANAKYPAHARVWRSMIALAPSDKPFLRAPKGSVMRRATYRLYEPEIQQLYHSGIRTDIESGGETTLSVTRAETLIRQAVRSVLGSTPFTDHTNLFTLGMDSLQVLQLSQILSRAMHHPGMRRPARLSCSPQAVYAHPTVSTLALALSSPRSLQVGSDISREERMSALIHTHTRSFPRTLDRIRQAIPDTNLTIILTGSTGSLGTHLLRRLLLDARVAHIHCFNRTSDAAERQARSLVAISPCPKEESLDRMLQKTTFHTVDLAHESFGLPQDIYTELVQSVHIVAHNAWPVDFNKQLGEFEGAIQGVRRLAEFAGRASWDVRVVFVSSVAGVMNYPAVRGAHLQASSVVWGPSLAKAGFARGSDFEEVPNGRGSDTGRGSDSSGNDSDSWSGSNTGGRSNSDDGEGISSNRESVDSEEMKRDDVDIPISDTEDVDSGFGTGADDDGLIIPEEFDSDNSLPAKQGYGESKHVAACILVEAARRMGLNVTILRAGQLAGPRDCNGIWNRHEWLPSLIATSKAVGKIPGSLGGRHDLVDWIPVDIAAQAALDLALSGQSGVASFNLVNPRTIHWHELVNTVREVYKSIEVVSLDEWVEDLVEAASKGAEPEQYPAVKLIDFFQGLVADREGIKYRFATDRAVQCSRVMAELDAVDGILMRKWLEAWAF